MPKIVFNIRCKTIVGSLTVKSLLAAGVCVLLVVAGADAANSAPVAQTHQALPRGESATPPAAKDSTASTAEDTTPQPDGLKVRVHQPEFAHATSSPPVVAPTQKASPLDF